METKKAGRKRKRKNKQHVYCVNKRKQNTPKMQSHGNKAQTCELSPQPCDAYQSLKDSSFIYKTQVLFARFEIVWNLMLTVFFS